VAGEVNIGVECITASDLMIAVPSRDLEVMILDPEGVQRSLRRGLCKVKSETGPILLRLFELAPEAGVVNLKDYDRAGRNLFGSPWRQDVDALPRSITSQQQSECIPTLACQRSLERRSAVRRAAAVVNHRSVRFDLDQRTIAVEDRVLHQRPRAAFALLELFDHLRSLDERDHVMHDPPVARHDLS